MLLNLVFWFLGGSGTGLVPHLTISKTVAQNGTSPVTRLVPITFSLIIDNETNFL
jgi:hypothetical protein